MLPASRLPHTDAPVAASWARSQVVADRSISDQKNFDGFNPVKNAWMARDGWRYGIPWTCDVNHPTNYERGSSLPWAIPRREAMVGFERRVRSVSDRWSDFVTGLALGSGKLRGLRRPDDLVGLPRAGPPDSGLLVTPFVGVPPGEPIGELSNARAESFMSRAHNQHVGFRGIESDVSKFLGNEMSLSYDSDTGRFLVESRHRPVAILTPPSQNGAQRPLSLSLYSSSRIRIKANGDLLNPFWAISWSRSRSRRPSTSNPKLTTQGIRETEPTMPTCDGDSSSGSGPNPNPNSVPKLSNGGTAPQLKRSRTITASLAPGGAAAVLGPQPPAVGRAATAPLPASRRLTVAVDNPSDVPSNGGVFDRDWYYPSFLGPYAVRPRATCRASSSGPKKLDVPLPPPSSTDRSSAAVSDEEEKEVVERPLVLEEKQGSFPSASRSPPKKNNRFDNNSLILSLVSFSFHLASLIPKEYSNKDSL
ncbi:hypothetical protein B296_00003488 [Ensete ventricosum]|uniref:Uncharacterized protein n=1 Tax=Ensete ventricosum TaxID=4639 RepID=A0A427B9B5_ENSVE|nr:hypothetical protein B296_00003488 [Ensete ventricosum]